MRAILTLLIICALSFSAFADKSKKSDKSKKADKSQKEFAVDIVQISYTTTLDDGSVVPMAQPLVFVAGRSFGKENKLTVTLANNLVVIDVDDNGQDNLFSFPLPEAFLDASGAPLAGDYLLQVSSGKSAKKQASHLLTVDPASAGLSISLQEEIALREAGDEAEAFARSSTDDDHSARIDANQNGVAGAQASADSALDTATAAAESATTAQALANAAQQTADQGLIEAVDAQVSANTNIAAIAVNEAAVTQAQTTASLGVTNSAVAQAAADAAQVSSDAAQATADLAVTQAAIAQASADAAQASSEAAQTTADLGVTNAAAAQSSADASQQSANTAQVSAEGAQASADGAATLAVGAQTSATAAQNTANGAVASSTAAQTTADQAVGAAGTADSKAQQALDGLEAIQLIPGPQGIQGEVGIGIQNIAASANDDGSFDLNFTLSSGEQVAVTTPNLQANISTPELIVGGVENGTFTQNGIVLNEVIVNWTIAGYSNPKVISAHWGEGFGAYTNMLDVTQISPNTFSGTFRAPDVPTTVNLEIIMSEQNGGNVARSGDLALAIVQAGLDPFGDGVDENRDGFDGDLSLGIFVKADATGSTGRYTDPVSLQRAIDIANNDGERNEIYLFTGDYVLDNTWEVLAGVAVHGGFYADNGTFWEHDDTSSFVSEGNESNVIVNPAAETQGAASYYVGVRAMNVQDPILLSWLSLNVLPAGTGIGTTSGDSIYAGHFSNSQEVNFRYLNIATGDAGQGGAGARGIDGAAGAGGVNGGRGRRYEDDRPGAGGAGGAGASGNSGGAGGVGGSDASNFNAAAGANGSGSAGGTGGAGGRISSLSSVGCSDGLPGRNGVNGVAGATGAHRSTASYSGSHSGAYYIPITGQTGGDGASGSGGGGGGGGGGQSGFFCQDGSGNGGGGGGAGGEFGTGGAGGFGGGANVGVLVDNVISTNLPQATIVFELGAAGVGGVRGTGGFGGRGGFIGAGADFETSEIGRGGNGGAGGNGGTGGRGQPGADGFAASYVILP